ncbi:MAG: hypothetical protein ABUL58_01330 [Steroidobacter sp.]
MATNTCEKEWREMQVDSRFNSLGEKIKHFENFSGTCKGSGNYEVRLSQLYVLARQFDKAKSIIEQGQTDNTRYAKELLAAKGDMYLIQQDLQSAEIEYRTAIAKYSNWADGYAGLGAVFPIEHRYEEGINYLQKAASIEPSANIYRNLVICYYQLRRDKEAIDSFNNAYQLDNGIFGDRDAAISVAISYARIGKLDVADDVLRGLLKVRPAMKDDPEFTALFKKINDKLDQLPKSDK